jgi:hypothetical protein
MLSTSLGETRQLKAEFRSQLSLVILGAGREHVEARRKFIEENALDVKNVDI